MSSYFFSCIANLPVVLYVSWEPEAIIGVNHRAPWTWGKEGSKPFWWRRRAVEDLGCSHSSAGLLFSGPHPPSTLGLTHQDATQTRLEAKI